MRYTTVLHVQHIGRAFRRHWRVQKTRELYATEGKSILEEKGIPVYEAKEILEEKREFQKIDFSRALLTKPPKRDGAHPLYKEKICHMYKDHNVLLEGLNQGKLLTKTVEIKNGLPEEIENLVGVQNLPDQDKLIQRCILTSHVFDATQVKLPKLRDPERPMWNFPRVYGIDNIRKNKLLSSKLIHLCEFVCGRGARHSLVQDEIVSTPFEKDGDLIQLELSVDFMLCTSKPLPVYASPEDIENTRDIELPNIFPIKHTVTLEKENIYELRNIFPILKGSQYPNVHTAIVHYDDTEVKNIFETPVTEEQILGRSLLKAFAIAAANAKQKYGLDVKDLPEPMTVQCIQTDGRLFHFTVLQLNTLDLDGTEGMKNIFWMHPRIPLFNSCKYEAGIPVLTEYNDEVFKWFLAFYSNSVAI